MKKRIEEQVERIIVEKLSQNKEILDIISTYLVAAGIKEGAVVPEFYVHTPDEPEETMPDISQVTDDEAAPVI